MKANAAAKATNHDDVYDRQIRLWGAEAQKRMSTARVLYIHLSGVSCEVLKNLILAGVAAVVCDGRAYPAAVREVPSSFFVAEEMEQRMMTTERENNDNGEEPTPMAKRAKVTKMTVADAVMPRIDELNPLLHGRNSVEDRDIMSLPPSYFGEFDAIVTSRLTVEEVKFISSCLGEQSGHDSAAGEEKRDNEQNNNGRNTLFIVADTFGLEGCAHLDFGKNHTYRRETGKDKLSDLSKVDPYVSMHDMFAMPLGKVKTGRWDKDIPRGILLQRLLIDYWAQQRADDQPEKDDDDDYHHRFVDFATNWFLSNNLSNHESATNHINFSQLAPIAAHPEISPVAATLGGLLGNEVIKALTGRGEPANNVLLFDGMDGGCRSFVLSGE